jgi:hypothetical protein
LVLLAVVTLIVKSLAEWKFNQAGKQVQGEGGE